MNDQAGEQIGHAEESSRQIAELYFHHADSLQRFLWGTLRDSDVAREALQSTFRIALESISEIPEHNRKGWLFRVAYNEAMALRRKEGVVRRNQPFAARSSQDGAAGPLELNIQWEDVRRVRQALDLLPEEQAVVVRLRIYENLTFQQISERHKCPLGTVLTRMRLAMEKLQRVLRENDHS